MGSQGRLRCRSGSRGRGRLGCCRNVKGGLRGRRGGHRRDRSGHRMATEPQEMWAVAQPLEAKVHGVAKPHHGRLNCRSHGQVAW